MIRISFAPGGQQRRDVCWLAGVGRSEGDYPVLWARLGNSVGRPAAVVQLACASPWGGTSTPSQAPPFPWSDSAVQLAQRRNELSHCVSPGLHARCPANWNCLACTARVSPRTQMQANGFALGRGKSFKQKSTIDDGCPNWPRKRCVVP
jgi:hypothetical protein